MAVFRRGVRRVGEGRSYGGRIAALAVDGDGGGDGAEHLALDILVTVFINLVLVTFAVNYFQLRDWRERKRNG